LGAFLGGGYGTTGHKTGSKLGGYFAGGFDPVGHSASDNLLWFRKQINQEIRFWKMEPYQIVYTTPSGIRLDIFSNVTMDTRLMRWPGNEYVIGGAGSGNKMVARLPEGRWEVVLYDILLKERIVVGKDISGSFSFDFGKSPAVMVHFKRF
jgi:hypothetical protein